jgi:hypothetical protein
VALDAGLAVVLLLGGGGTCLGLAMCVCVSAGSRVAESWVGGWVGGLLVCALWLVAWSLGRVCVLGGGSCVGWLGGWVAWLCVGCWVFGWCLLNFSVMCIWDWEGSMQYLLPPNNPERMVHMCSSEDISL